MFLFSGVPSIEIASSLNIGRIHKETQMLRASEYLVNTYQHSPYAWQFMNIFLQ